MTTLFPIGRGPILVALAVLLSSCAAQLEHRNALQLLAAGKSGDGIEALRRASSLEPDNVAYRMEYLSRREAELNKILREAEEQRAAGQLEAAAQRFREAVRVDPGSDRARLALHNLDTDRRAIIGVQAADRLLQANQNDAALEQVRRVLKDSPRHLQALALQRTLEDRIEADRQAREEQLAARAAFRRPVTLQFRDAPVRLVFEAIGKLGNVNVVIDRDVRADLRATIFVKDAAIEDALDVILLQNQLEKRLLNSNTLLIYPSNPTKIKELAELKVRSFHLSNVDVAFMANIIKTMVKTKDLVTDVKSNTLVMRDVPEAIALAERLIAANDLPDAEVMLEVEVLEISSSRVSEIGLKLPGALSIGVPTPSAGSLIVGALRAVTGNDLLLSPLQATLNLMMQDGDANVLASPRIRSRSKEKAKILVGDKLPIITNLLSPQQAGQSSVVTGSIQYVEVGIKLEVEPQVYADGDVGIKMSLEVSNVTDTIQTDSGRAYQIGTRSAQSTIRLRDGETQVMAGLINDADRNSAYKVPGIGQLPIVGRLFSNQSDNSRKTEIVLSITPRIIRPHTLPDIRNAEAWSGTESSIRDRSLRIEPLAVLKASAPKAEAPPAPPTIRPNVPAPAVSPAASPSVAPAPPAGNDSAPASGAPAVGMPAASTTIAPAASTATSAMASGALPSTDVANVSAPRPGVVTPPPPQAAGQPLVTPRAPTRNAVATQPAPAAAASSADADKP